METLTLNWIISTLNKTGIDSKHVVIERLKKASYNDLLQLRNSINEEIINKERKKNDFK